MIHDPDGARKFTSPKIEIIFTGTRRMSDPADTAAINANRYVDRYAVSHELIMRLDLWNDSAERQGALNEADELALLKSCHSTILNNSHVRP